MLYKYIVLELDTKIFWLIICIYLLVKKVYMLYNLLYLYYLPYCKFHFFIHHWVDMILYDIVFFLCWNVKNFSDACSFVNSVYEGNAVLFVSLYYLMSIGVGSWRFVANGNYRAIRVWLNLNRFYSLLQTKVLFGTARRVLLLTAKHLICYFCEYINLYKIHTFFS